LIPVRHKLLLLMSFSAPPAREMSLSGIIMGAVAATVVAMLPLLVMGLDSLTGFALIIILGAILGTLTTRPAYGRIMSGLQPILRS
jgi:preprotein translocase subunit SecD